MARLTGTDAKNLYELYDSIYEKKDCVDKKDKGTHNCAKKVCHEEYGEGMTIFGEHAIPDENGFVSHYNVEFENVIVENVPVEQLEIITMVEHPEHVEHEGDELNEGLGERAAEYIDKGLTKVQKGLEKVGIKPNNTKRGTARPSAEQAETMRKNKQSNESIDIFDVVKGYLIDEGYAETEEAALSIMANMSEGWKDEIIASI
jgi:hypothetical protein